MIFKKPWIYHQNVKSNVFLCDGAAGASFLFPCTYLNFYPVCMLLFIISFIVKVSNKNKQIQRHSDNLNKTLFLLHMIYRTEILC